MRIVLLAVLLVIGLAAPLQAAGKSKAPTWTDPAKAAKEHPDFLIQGEYVGERDGKKIGLLCNNKRAGKPILTVAERILKEHFKDVETSWFQGNHFSVSELEPARKDEFESWLNGVDAVIAAVAD